MSAEAINAAARAVAHAIDTFQDFRPALAAYRAALAPVSALRTRAEVDAELRNFMVDNFAKEDLFAAFNPPTANAIWCLLLEPTREPEPAPADSRRLTEATKLLQAFCNGGHPIEAAQRWLRDERRAQEQGEAAPVAWPSCAPDCRLPHIHDRPIPVHAPPTELVICFTCHGEHERGKCPKPAELERDLRALADPPSAAVARELGLWPRDSMIRLLGMLARCWQSDRLGHTELGLPPDQVREWVAEAKREWDNLTRIRTALGEIRGLANNAHAYLTPKDDVESTPQHAIGHSLEWRHTPGGYCDWCGARRAAQPAPGPE